jgi:hypothetical protein
VGFVFCLYRVSVPIVRTEYVTGFNASLLLYFFFGGAAGTALGLGNSILPFFALLGSI